jgi:hypothetical protein
VRASAPRYQINLSVNEQVARLLELAAREQKLTASQYVRKAVLDRLTQQTKTTHSDNAHSANESE